MTYEYIYKNSEWIKIALPSGEYLYFFPSSLTVIEYDSQFGDFLTDLKIKTMEEILQIYPEDYVTDNLHNLQILWNEGYLKPLNNFEKPSDVSFKRIILANTMKCNLACNYCYNRFDFNSQDKNDMSNEVFRKLTKFMEKNGKDTRVFELLFIGGEPLMNMTIIKEALKWRERLNKKGKDLLIAPTTNATLLTEEIIDYCNKNRIYLKITLDGDETEHDRNRIFPDGSGSYEKIMEVLPWLFSKYNNPFKYVTTTIDTLKSDPEERVIRFSAMGFNMIELTETYSSQNNDFSGTELEENFRQKYRKLFNFLDFRIRSRNYLHIVPLYGIIKTIHTRVPLLFSCRAGIDSFGVDIEGNIYLCHHFFGDKRFILGNVMDRKFSQGQLYSYRLPVTERAECVNCYGRFICGGGCYHRNLAFTGDIFLQNKKECIRKKALYTEAIIFYNKLRNTDSPSLDWYIQTGSVY